MMRLIRSELMAQDDVPLSGEVEADETFIGGQPRLGEIARYRREGDWNRFQPASRWSADPKNKATVFGMVERGGRVRAQVVPSRQGVTLDGLMTTHILPESPRSSPMRCAPTSRSGASSAATIASATRHTST
jgi:hypothetical protein